MKYKSTISLLLISFLFTSCIADFEDHVENVKGIIINIRNYTGKDIKEVRLVIGTQIEDIFVASDTLVVYNVPDYETREIESYYGTSWDTDLSHIDKAYFKLFYQHDLNWNSFPIDLGRNDYLQIPRDKIVSNIDTPELRLDIEIK